jgi:hypothetical protein
LAQAANDQTHSIGGNIHAVLIDWFVFNLNFSSISAILLLEDVSKNMMHKYIYIYNIFHFPVQIFTIVSAF